MGSSPKYGSACLSIFLGLVIGQGLAFGAENRLTVTTPEKTVSFTLEELKKKLPVVIWKMKLPHWAFPWAESDPVYGKESEYEGFELSEVLKLAGFDLENESLKADELVMEALDGYNPNVPLDEIRANRALVAFRVKGLKDPWRPVQQGKAMLSPAPFFILWEKKAAENQHFPWLYQLAKLELVTFSRKFAKLYPEGARADSSEMRGVIHFQDPMHQVSLRQSSRRGPGS